MSNREKISFAEELTERIVNNRRDPRGVPVQVSFFLKVVKRGCSFPLGLDPKGGLKLEVFLVPEMILAVIGSESGYYRAIWNGPVLETDQTVSRRFSPNGSFEIFIPKEAVDNGDLVLVPKEEVVKMANHVPAVLCRPVIGTGSGC